MNNLKVKILFLGSRKLAENILNWILKNENGCEVIGVVLPTFEGWWEDGLHELTNKYDLRIFNQIENTLQFEYDLIISVNYWKLIPTEFLNKVNGNAVNIHHSYKLKFKGRFSTSWAIMHARKDNCWEHGTSIHYISEFLDSGRIIATEKVMISEIDTAETLFLKVENVAFELFKKSFSLILLGTQVDIPYSETTYFYDRFSKDTINLPNPISHEDLYDFTRAWTFEGRPSPSILLPNGNKIILSLKSSD
jgi:methionyl-tRNA formyltransferase